jgi:hypothetical protein
MNLWRGLVVSSLNRTSMVRGSIDLRLEGTNQYAFHLLLSTRTQMNLPDFETKFRRKLWETREFGQGGPAAAL